MGSYQALVRYATVAQLVERYLAKVQVDGSNPFSRSIYQDVTHHRFLEWRVNGTASSDLPLGPIPPKLRESEVIVSS